MPTLSDLLERFRRAPEVLATMLTGVKPDEEDYSPGPGKWTIRQIAAHLADAELVAGHRLRQVMAEDNPTLVAYDQDAWARNLNYTGRKLKTSLESFRRLRAENYELIKDLPQAAFNRAGTHSEHGRMTLHDMLTRYATHAENHARQMQAIREAVKAVRR